MLVLDTVLVRVAAFYSFAAARCACSVVAKEATLDQVVAVLVRTHAVAPIAVRRGPSAALVFRHSVGDGEMER